VAAITTWLLGRHAATIAIGHGRDPNSAAAAEALATSWREHGGTVVALISWPPRAASWLRQARQLVTAQPDAWVIADSAAGFAPVAARLLQQPGWRPADTLGFAGLANVDLISRVGPGLEGLAGATADGARWRFGRTSLIIEQ
jgi:hypothetical protein